VKKGGGKKEVEGWLFPKSRGLGIGSDQGLRVGSIRGKNWVVSSKDGLDSGNVSGNFPSDTINAEPGRAGREGRGPPAGVSLKAEGWVDSMGKENKVWLSGVVDSRGEGRNDQKKKLRRKRERETCHQQNDSGRTDPKKECPRAANRGINLLGGAEKQHRKTPAPGNDR